MGARLINSSMPTLASGLLLVKSVVYQMVSLLILEPGQS